jgi:hypothetical protein
MAGQEAWQLYVTLCLQPMVRYRHGRVLATRYCCDVRWFRALPVYGVVEEYLPYPCGTLVLVLLDLTYRPLRFVCVIPVLYEVLGSGSVSICRFHVKLGMPCT